jgi:6-phosphofructokinase 1
VNPSYLYRSGAPNKLDRFWAQKLGKAAIKFLEKGIDESNFLAIQKDNSGFKIKNIPLSKFTSIGDLHRFVDERLYNPQEFQVTENGKKYLRDIVIEFPLEKSYGLSNKY